MNTYKVKTINFRNRIARFLKSKKDGNKSTSVKRPAINNLYRISFENEGKLQTNVIARYDGKSRSGLLYKFALPEFLNSKGVKLNLVCLSEIPQQMRLLKASLFSDLSKVA